LFPKAKMTEAEQTERIKAWLTQDGKACPRLDRGIANMRERLASVSEFNVGRCTRSAQFENK
jgi:hypothetical protein